jgi:OPA family sugar phosphate sensor protein UhpC-like MFS transporter
LNKRYERWRWLTFGITWLIYVSFYLARQSFGVAKVAFADDPHVSLTRKQFGLIDSSFQVTYMLGQFIFGPLGDRFGPRRILLFGMALIIAVSIASGFSTTLSAFLILALIHGIGQSSGWSNISKTMSSWFSLRERGRVIGLWCTHYTVGGAIALPFGGWLMEHYGSVETSATGVARIPFWPAAFWGPAAVMVIVWILSWILLRNRPEDLGLPPIEKYHGEPESLLPGEDKQHVAVERSWSVIREVLTSPPIWMLSTSYFFIKLVRYSFYFWGPLYVEECLGSGAYESTLIAAAMPLGGLLGVIATGYISDLYFSSRRAPVIVVSLLLTSVVMVFGLIPIHNAWLMAGFFFLVGMFIFGPDSMISATAAMDFGTKRGAGTAIGCINGIGSIGGILGGYLPGAMTEKADWTPLFLLFFVGLALAAAAVAPLWRTQPPQA